ncbi:dynein axonemal assembly factor 9-like [Physella acuta]|uniref:dynein axonemal assembly factor 9-like n=1 Tax=Physella acuta TaxID=109671 RepID=UPI0027DE34FE|nr:dynein axonemal assembly factor 9-like [Physella acuta]
MAAHKFKTPSSARRHIKIEQFSQFVSATRLRHVQNILANRKAGSADIDGILCISGVDSRYNEGMYELLNYLLFGFFDARKEELESSGFAEEVIEDLMILICSDRVEVYCNPVNYHYFLPYVSHWPGLVFHCLTEDEYNREDDDTVEEFKIRSLIAMVGSFKVIGLPFSGRGQEAPFNVMAIEKWPIIQAFALDDFGGGGFFSLKFEVIDISSQVHHLQDFQDPVSVEHLLTEHFSLMARQWDNMMKCVQLSLESSSSVLSQKKVTEPIRSYFLHGLVGHKGNVGKVPFVVFSPDSHRQHMQELKDGRDVQLSDLSLKCDRPCHMICQVASPHNPLACTRTYFFCNEPYIITKGGSGDGLQHSHKNTFLRYTVHIYLSMIKSVLAAIQVYACTASVSKLV